MGINEILNFWEALGKDLSIVTATLTATVTIISKIAQFFSDFTAKVKLKRDLELLKLASETSTDTILIKGRIAQSIKSLYKERRKITIPSVPNLLSALLGGGGFAWWTYSIYIEHDSFSPWMLLTTLLSLVGFSIAFGPDPAKEIGPKKKKPVFAIYVFSWTNALINLTLAISSVWGSITLFRESGFSGWHILIAVG